MKKKRELYRILSKGGVLTPALFLETLQLAESVGNDHIFFGSRQDLLFYLPTDINLKQHKKPELSIYKRSAGIQNLVSSFVCTDILPSTDWIYSGTYLKVIDQFSFDHHLKVNIADPKQNLVPLFYGNLNFIASEIPNYWHLYIKFNYNKEPQLWPGLIFTDDIAEFAQIIESLILEEKISTIDELANAVQNMPLKRNILESSVQLSLPTGFFPYYEGLNKIDGKNAYWAGFYWRNNQYPIQFLKEVCWLCQKSNIGKIFITPWKTFLIKDISVNDKILWDELIGRYGINMRHSSFELNWHLPLVDTESLKLKKYIVSQFDKFDIRTFGLSFSIQPKSEEKLTSIIIRPKGRFPFLGRFDFTKTYSIEYAYDYNPNSNNYIEYAGNLNKNELPDKLNEISKRYYAQLFSLKQRVGTHKNERPKQKLKKVFQCPDCMTIYDDQYGDILAGIEAGTRFSLLPENYKCQVCDAPKIDFTEIEIKELAS